MNLAEKLAGYAFQFSYRELPEQVIHEVKRRVIDSFGCALGALSSDPAKIIRKVLTPFQLKSGATLLGEQHRVSPDLATFYNGLLIRYLDYNDTYLSKEPAHPSDNISSALALAETEQRSGRELIEATVLGYEIQCRLCDGASIRSKGWDHVTYGAFSTALLASKLLKLSQNKMVHAIGLAGTPNIALRQTRVGELSMWKGCAFANAARNGVFAALLASKGMTGPAPIFEGTLGFFNLVSGPFEIKKWGGRNSQFKIMDTSIKYYPAEYHAQGAIEAALVIRKEMRREDIHSIQSIDVKTFKTAIEIIGGEREKWHPQFRETADHSMPYCIAVSLMDGEVGELQFSKKRMRDPRLYELIERVKIEEDSPYSRMYPQGVPVHLRITTKSGKIFEKEIIYPKGHARAPLTDGEIEHKFKRLTFKTLSEAQQKQALERLWDLEKIKDVGEIMKLFNFKKGK